MRKLEKEGARKHDVNFHNNVPAKNAKITINLCIKQAMQLPTIYPIIQRYTLYKITRDLE